MATSLQKKVLTDHARRARIELEEIYERCIDIPDDASDIQNSATETLTYLENVELYVSQLPVN